MELLAIMFWMGMLGIGITIMVNAERWANRLFPLNPPKKPVQHCQSMVDAVRRFEQEVNAPERRER